MLFVPLRQLIKENMKTIGRKREQDELLSRYHSNSSEFIAIYGRRRVGKTFLVNSTFKDQYAFKHTGLSPFEDGSKRKITMADQLLSFHYSLLRYGQSEDTPVPQNWQEAFFRLERLLQTKADGHKMVVFIDEMPWMDTPRSKFVSAFENFENNWVNERDDIMLIICGSSSSWILKRIVHNKGGLYDRVTCHMKLIPFTLKETEEFFRSKGVEMERYDIVRTYMAFGGVPYYLGYIKPGLSVEQNIDEILFRENAPLSGEFNRLFNTLFTNSEKYVKLVRFLVKRNYGYTREEISKGTGISEGGGLSDYLTKLAEADFIDQYRPAMSVTKEDYYRLKDCFCIFWLRFIEGKAGKDPHFWQNNYTSNKIVSWQGIAFEQICLSHVESIRRALGINGTNTVTSKMIIPSEKPGDGGQIDLVIERSDRNANLCEMKFYSSEVSLDQKENLILRDRKDRFKEKYKVKGQVFLTLVTSFGLKYGTWSGVYGQTLTLDDLFQ